MLRFLIAVLVCVPSLVHRQGAVLAAKRVSGSLSACMQGTITLQ